jgi:CheY-like chemotaxis protein
VTLAYAEIETAEASKDKRLKPGAYVKISISDTGCGMDKALMERIFDPFFTTKEVGKGTGLGLAMVHGIVEDYGGLLLVESEVGKGTCFRIFFPYVQAASHEDPLATEDAGGRLEKILIVDSDEGLVETLRQSLETLGYRVTGMTACEEALEAFRAARPAFDLVVTNPTMPDMTGIQLAETVVDLRPEVPVILCTDLARDVLTPQIKDLNIADVIRKPITVEAMGKVIRKVLDAQGALV